MIYCIQEFPTRKYVATTEEELWDFALKTGLEVEREQDVLRRYQYQIDVAWMKIRSMLDRGPTVDLDRFYDLEKLYS